MIFFLAFIYIFNIITSWLAVNKEPFQNFAIDYSLTENFFHLAKL